MRLAGQGLRWASRRRGPALVAVSACLILALATPAGALAHGIAGRTDLPLPRWLFAWAAAVVLIASFIALASMWPRPRLEYARSRVLARVPGALQPLCGGVGIALFALVVWAGFEGEQELPTANITPTFIFVLFWVGIPFASVLFGDVFRVFSPWRAFARAVSWTAGRLRHGRRPVAPFAYPRWLGRWPAAAGVIGFAWLELIYVERDRPSTLALLSLGYAVVMLVGMGLYGIETWSTRGDAFGVAFNLFGRLSPLDWREKRLEARLPLAGVVHLERMAGTVGMLAAMIGSTSFDGLQQGLPWMNTLAPELQSFFSGLGLGPTPAAELAGTVGLLAMWGFVAGFYRLGIRGMQSIDPRMSARFLAGRFVHTLTPIAAAYVMAHYFSLLVWQSQATVYLISDPLGHGWNLFGTANYVIDYSVLTPNSIWYFQVAVLLTGHVCGLALAHDRALVLYPDPRDAVRSQYWMLVVMVGFTCLGLWLLSAAS